MKNNIFFKAVPGLFKRKKIINNPNQSLYYENKILKSISNLENTNKGISENVMDLNVTASDLGERIKRIVQQLYEFNDNHNDSIVQLKEFVQEEQKNQYITFRKEYEDLRTSIHELQAAQDTNNINIANEHEILTLLLEGVYERLQTLQDDLEVEMKKLAGRIDETKKEVNENSGIHLENDKIQADLLFKMREFNFELENNQLAEQKNLTNLIYDLRQDVSRLQDKIERTEQVIKK
ncbi:hypothetical protein QA612_06930 [Evansella sp. AB-P1]|uniref:hypothetical protein n=1 Tax=Evansella sp. AB-P1 TaxID=3037653 RepID=UPI00241CF2DA|nr:hypothetical protein [Evansella sp. AB-P1]MDG5787222.1 hypothetical protein [Evansella sp. AB-P1]